MRLSEKDRRILRAVELTANKPMGAIRMETGYRDHTIRYQLNRLLEQGIIKRRSFINPYPLGLVEYALYFSVAGDEKVSVSKFLDTLSSSPRVSWMVSLGGDYQYGVAISASHHSEVVSFIDELSEGFPNIFFDRALSIRNSLTVFPRKAFGSGKSKVKPLSFGGAKTNLQVDQKDLKILGGLDTLHYTSHRDLARQLEMPISTFTHRIERLEKEGVIVGYLYRIEMAKLGYQIFRVLIHTRGLSAAFREELYNFAEAHPAINYYIHCLGDWDNELGVEVESPQEVVLLTQALSKQFTNRIRAIKVLPVFEQRKILNFPFQN